MTKEILCKVSLKNSNTTLPPMSRYGVKKVIDLKTGECGVMLWSHEQNFAGIQIYLEKSEFQQLINKKQIINIVKKLPE